MQTWFSCKVKYQKIDEHGKQVRASETYLVEAINFTEAETRSFEIMEQYGSGDIMVSGISKTLSSQNSFGGGYTKVKTVFDYYENQDADIFYDIYNK